MTIFPQFFTLRDAFLAITKRTERQVHEELQPPQSDAFFCPECGVVWAKAAITNQRFRVHSLRCEKHPTELTFSPSGSLWLSWDLDYLDALPEVIVKREFELMMNLYKEYGYVS